MIADDFRRFHAENPQVYAELVRLARLWKERRGVEHVGVATIYEVCRWNLALSTTGDPFKLNNNYRALYAREIMRNEPDLRGLFHIRQLKSGSEHYARGGLQGSDAADGLRGGSHGIQAGVPGSG